MRFQIERMGFYAPPRVESAHDLDQRLGLPPGWTERHTGVLHRRVAEEPVEEMAAAAAREALGDGPPPDLILNASATPRQLIPDTSVFVERALGFDGIPAHSIHATCLSFAVAVHAAGAYIESGAYRRVLVVSAEIASVGRDYAEPESAALLGDGAAAALVVPTPAGSDSALLGWQMGTWPKGAELTEFRGAGTAHHPNDPTTTREDNLFHMNGMGVYKMARRRVAVVLRRLCDKAGVSIDEIDLVVPHQASGPALEASVHYGIPMSRLVNIVGEYGNCIAASLPMALYQAQADGRLQRGDKVLLVGTGAGLSVAAMLLRW